MCVDLSLEVYELTRKFPKQVHVLSNQIKRTADPVRADFMETVCFPPENQLRKSLYHANRAALDLVNSLYAVKKRNLICEQEFHELFRNYDAMAGKFQGLARFIR